MAIFSLNEKWYVFYLSDHLICSKQKETTLFQLSNAVLNMLKEYLVQFSTCIESYVKYLRIVQKEWKNWKGYFQVENVLVDVLIVTRKNQLMMAF